MDGGEGQDEMDRIECTECREPLDDSYNAASNRKQCRLITA
jgi:hypothetical protein